MEVAQRSGLSSYQCKHIRSVNYCTSSAEPVSLKEEILSEMQKKIPVDLPDEVRAPSQDKDYPRILCPDECVCQICPGVPLSEPILITKKAKILTNWSIIEDVATYCKQCPLCGMFYRYQEWKDHLHNFDDHNILAIPLCLTLRSLLQVHTSVSRAVAFLEDLTGGAKNPFAVKPTYHFWAPWIGKNTRRSDSVLNTEYKKLHSSKSASETAEITVTEERLKEELQKQKVNVIRNLCKECGLDSTGSRSDLLLRLSNEMKSRQTYDKIFEKIWGASEDSDISIDEPVPTDIEMEDVTPTSMMVPTSTENEMVCNYKRLSASRVRWDCVPTPRQSAMLEWALGTGNQDETIAEVGNVVLKRKDFWTLGLDKQLEATIANSCLEVIALVAKERGFDVWTANAYVVVTWLPPYNLDPSLSFPVMKPKDRHMFFLDSTNPYGLGDERYVKAFSKMTAKIATGTWVLLKNKDMPQQIGGVDCGVFMLMYALHLTLGAPFDFTSCDMPKIRRWWTLILLENFGVFSER
ncbi:HMG domain-containing 3-like isoform X2 [Labeo rohita]|uniref:HMG domain-containing 3-like isoform X2 n=2 Tax=Labeo rohita TaxID=84645 RepID=A0A498M6E1_LABRO|nr:HMG domain-containing 3-like isoform X2 [Labeo rohita]